MKRLVFLSIFIILSFILSSCGNPVKQLRKQIKSHGYILYQTPLKFAGPGTLVGGAPSMLSLVSHPETCFPDKINGFATNLRKYDEANLPSRYKEFEVSGGANIDLLDFLGQGQGSIKAGVKFEQVTKMSVEFSGVTIEYFDSVQLKRFYDHHMNSLCKDFLEKVGFIIQALRVESMSLKFENQSGGYIELSAEAIKELFDFSVDVAWKLKDKFTLVIDTPKYIGFQLGKLQAVDNGYALQRARKIKNNTFLFETLDIFGGPRNPTRVILGMPNHQVRESDFNWDILNKFL